MKKHSFRLLDLWILAAVLLILGIVNQEPAERRVMEEDVTAEVRKEVTSRQQSPAPGETLRLFGLDDPQLVARK